MSWVAAFISSLLSRDRSPKLTRKSRIWGVLHEVCLVACILFEVSQYALGPIVAISTECQNILT